MKYYTLGYGGRGKEEFLQLLKEKGIRTVVSVRLRPDRSSLGYAAEANDPAKGIQAVLSREGIQYVSLVELGNPFIDCEDWKDRYVRLMKAAGGLLSERLMALTLPAPFCLLCGEKKVADCHRQYIAEHLMSQGHQVEHIE